MVDLKRIIEAVRPSERENRLLTEKVGQLLATISHICSEESISAKPMLVGSVSKGTALRGSDLDIFVIFSKKYNVREMEKLGLRIGHMTLRNGIEKYAEHPYVTGSYEGSKVDIVPCFEYHGEGRIISSVDRTPLHTEFIRENLSDEQKDEVRLLKLFLKHGDIYGSEIRVLGFSGYVCELLIYHYGNFMGVIEAFSKCGPEMVISKPIQELPPSPLIIMDPTDHSRNASAAVSRESYNRMIVLSKCYLASPTEKFFEKPEKKVAKFRPGRGVMFLLTMEKPDLVDDIIYSQARKLERSIHDISDLIGFRLYGTELECDDKISILVETQEDKIPPFRLHLGPPVFSPNVIEFLRKWESDPSRVRGPYILGDRVAVEVSNSNRDIKSILIEEIRSKNIGKHLNPIKNTIRIERLEPGSESTILWSYYNRRICCSDSS